METYTAIGCDIDATGTTEFQAASDSEALRRAREWAESTEWSAESLPVRILCGERRVGEIRVRTV